MLQMVAAGRGVAALPRWLVEEHAARACPGTTAARAQGRAEADPPGSARASICIHGYLRAFIDTRAGRLIRRHRWHNLPRQRASSSTKGEIVMRQTAILMLSICAVVACAADAPPGRPAPGLSPSGKPLAPLVVATGPAARC